MTRRSPLDDPTIAAYAWARYRRLMRWMFGFTAVVVIFALTLVYVQIGPTSIHLYIATALGVGFAVLLMSALMGLVFLSSGTGHDESVADADAEGDSQAEDDSGRSR
jgi:uncharacterized membrane protein